MGLSVVGHTASSGSGTAPDPASGEKYREKARKHLQEVLSGILRVLAEAASGEAASYLECPTWHLQMACNYLKLAASERSLAQADAVDAARDRLTDSLFFLQASLIVDYRNRTEDRAQRLLEGLKVMAAVSSLLPADVLAAEPFNEHDFF